MEKRTVQEYNAHACEGDEWVDIEFKDVKKGMTVRLFEKNGDVVTDDDGKTIFITTTSAYKNAMCRYTFNYGD